MIIHLSNKKKYKKSDSYSKKMTYSISMYGYTYKDYQELCKHPVLSKKNVIWYTKSLPKKKR